MKSRAPALAHRLRAGLQVLAERAQLSLAEIGRIRAGDPLAVPFASFGAGSRIDAPRVGISDPSCISIGTDVEIRSYVNMETIAPTGKVVLSIGDRVIIGHFVRFVALNGIVLEEDSGIGHGCTVADTVHDWRGSPEGTHPGHTPLTVGPALRVERGAWVGNGCVLMGGLTIGARSIIGANSVVTRSVPPDTIVAGNPAKLSGDMASLRRFYRGAASDRLSPD